MIISSPESHPLLRCYGGARPHQYSKGSLARQGKTRLNLTSSRRDSVMQILFDAEAHKRDANWLPRTVRYGFDELTRKGECMLEVQCSFELQRNVSFFEVRSLSWKGGELILCTLN